MLGTYSLIMQNSMRSEQCKSYILYVIAVDLDEGGREGGQATHCSENNDSRVIEIQLFYDWELIGDNYRPTGRERKEFLLPPSILLACRAISKTDCYN